MAICVSRSASTRVFVFPVHSAGRQVDAMSFDLTGTSADDRMFIGNIRVAKN